MTEPQLQSKEEKQSGKERGGWNPTEICKNWTALDSTGQDSKRTRHAVAHVPCSRITQENVLKLNICLVQIGHTASSVGIGGLREYATNHHDIHNAPP